MFIGALQRVHILLNQEQNRCINATLHSELIGLRGLNWLAAHVDNFLKVSLWQFYCHWHASLGTACPPLLTGKAHYPFFTWPVSLALLHIHIMQTLWSSSEKIVSSLAWKLVRFLNRLEWSWWFVTWYTFTTIIVYRLELRVAKSFNSYIKIIIVHTSRNIIQLI